MQSKCIERLRNLQWKSQNIYPNGSKNFQKIFDKESISLIWEHWFDLIVATQKFVKELLEICTRQVLSLILELDIWISLVLAPDELLDSGS